MRIKANGQYLQFDDELEIDRSVKLFDDVSTVVGDFSYSSSMPRTRYNEDIIGYFGINSTEKPWTTKIPSSIETDSGTELYNGFIRIESSNDREYQFSFFSGNSNWLDELNEDAASYPQQDNLEISDSNIRATWSNNEGITFPLVDAGDMSTKFTSFFYDLTKELYPFIYVKTAIANILSNKGIKIKGDILNNSKYNKLITSNNGGKYLDVEKNNRKANPGKTSNQSIPSPGTTKITFTSVSSPYSNSPLGNWETSQSRYVFDKAVSKITFDVTIKIDVSILGPITFTLSFFKNNSVIPNALRGYSYLIPGTNIITIKDTITVDEVFEANDFIDIRISYSAVFGSPTATVIATSEMTITIDKFAHVFSNTLLPSRPASEFIRDIFRICGILCTYNSKTKTIETRSFDNIINQEPIDLSNNIIINSIDYISFIDSYNQENELLWTDQDSEDIDTYNALNTIPYGGGIINVDNGTLNKKGSLFELDFIAANQRSDKNFGTSIPQINFAEPEQIKIEENVSEYSVTSVSNSSGDARFNLSSTFPSGYVYVRIENSSIDAYNGDHIITSGGGTANLIMLNCPYVGTATADLIPLDMKDQSNEDQILLLNEPDQSLSNFSTLSEVYNPNGDITSIAVAWFYRPKTSFQFDNVKRDGLYFDRIGDSNNISIIESEYNYFQKLLNNGSKIICEAYLPEKIFLEIDFIRPIRINTKDIQGLFFLNLIRGYKNSYTPCELELIKLG